MGDFHFPFYGADEFDPLILREHYFIDIRLSLTSFIFLIAIVSK